MHNLNRGKRSSKMRAIISFIKKSAQWAKTRPLWDVMILKIFSPKKLGEKTGVFDSKQS
jgi:hypothetical protein